MRTLLSTFALSIALSAPASAALIAEYNFDDKTAENAVSAAYDLNSQGSAADFSDSAFYSDGISSNYLSVSGPGGMTDWTVSLWVNTSVSDQGEFKGIFSNMNDPQSDWSWQIDSHNGDYRLLSKQNDNSPVSLGTSVNGMWQHIFVQKFGGNDARLYFNGTFVENTGFNPGGLQNFRVGINRSSNSSYEGYIDNIQIWDDSTVSASQIYSNGVGVNAVPAPTSVALLGLALIGMGAYRRKAK